MIAPTQGVARLGGTLTVLASVRFRAGPRQFVIPTTRDHNPRENPMAARTYPHSIRLSQNEWRAVYGAAERPDMKPGAFVREAAARAAAEDGGHSYARLTPELIDLLKKTFRGVQLLAYLKREELEELERLEDFENAAEAARSEQEETFRAGDEQQIHERRCHPAATLAHSRVVPIG